MPRCRCPRSDPRLASVTTVLLLGALGVLVACEHRGPAQRADSGTAASGTTAGAVSPPVDRSGWNPAAGPTLLVQGRTIDEAIAIFPFTDDTLNQAHLDSASTNGASAMLFGRGGARFDARLGALPDETESACERWLLRDVMPLGTGRTWAVGTIICDVIRATLPT